LHLSGDVLVVAVAVAVAVAVDMGINLKKLNRGVPAMTGRIPDMEILPWKHTWPLKSTLLQTDRTLGF
jgi:hypothetical protein